MRPMILRPWVVILAAGGSRRFGGPKLLARIGGESLIRRAVRAALGCNAAGCVVVLGGRARELARELRGYPVRIALNRGWRSGLASSIRTGIGALPREAAAAVLVPGDQYAVGPAELALLIAAWRLSPAAIVAARSAGVTGPPAVFPRRSFPALARLRGDAGARALLRDRRRHVVAVEMPGILSDVDSPEDLRDAQRAWVQS